MNAHEPSVGPEPDVTCIIALYECAATVGAAIESALAQEGLSVEVIVVDDASPSGIAPEAERWAAAAPKGVRIIRRDRNGGPGAARNEGLVAARGRWIAVLDADDVMVPSRIAAMLAKAAEADILLDNPLVARTDAPKMVPMFDPGAWTRLGMIGLADFVRGNTLFDDAFNYGYVKPLVRREIVERFTLRYDETLRIGEDFLFLANALAHGACCRAVPVSGYVYNVREGSVSRVLKLDHVQEMRAGDARFLARHATDEPARRAFARRAASFERAENFLDIVEALKAGRLVDAAVGIAKRPGAALLLRMPLMVRLKRVAAHASTLVRRARGPVNLERSA